MLPLLGIIPEELNELLPFLDGNGKAMRILHWLYRKKILHWDQMDDIPKQIRKQLADSYVPGFTPPEQRICSSDNSVKYLFRTSIGRLVEAVYIPEGKRHTVCVSVQAGCRMGCAFCQTGRIGFHGNLSAGEIVNQLCSIEEAEKINHVVFMGMGEPLDNLTEVTKAIHIIGSNWGLGLGQGHITISTVGKRNGIHKLFNETKAHLALSLHNPFHEERMSWIPYERKEPVRDMVMFLKDLPADRRRRISAEYLMVKGLNDRDEHLHELIALLKNSAVRVNLIPFNPVPHLEWETSGSQRIQHFFKSLNQAGISATIRKSRGQDIGAACGLLGSQKQTGS